MIEVIDEFPLFSSKADYADLGICVITNGEVNKDGVAYLTDKFAIDLNRRLHFNRKLGEYILKWGNRSYYLGTYQKEKNGVKFKLFSFPVSAKRCDGADLTRIVQSSEELERNCIKYGIKNCFLPSVVSDQFCNLSYENVVKPTLDLILDDKFFIDVGKFSYNL